MTFHLDLYCLLWNNETISQTNSPQCHFTAAIYQNEIYVTPTGSVYICSTHNEVLTIILKYLRCSLSFAVSEQNYGGILVNGTWNGILGLFQSNQSDFIPHIFTNSYGRETLIEFDFLIPQAELLTIFSYPRLLLTRSPINLLKIFTPTIWLLVAITFLLYGAINWANASSSSSWLDLLTRHFFVVFALMIGQGTVKLSIPPRPPPLRHPLLLWVAFSFLMRQLFSSQITANLLARNEFKLEQFDQLFQLEPQIKLMLVERSTTYYYFTMKYPTLSARTVIISFQELTAWETLQKVLDQKYLIILPRGQAETITKYYSNIRFHISREGFVSVFGNYAIRKTLQKEKKALLNQLFKNLYYFGIDQKLDRTIELNNFHVAHRKPKDGLVELSSPLSQWIIPPNAAEANLTFSAMLTFACLYLGGIVFAFTIFLIELIAHYARCQLSLGRVKRMLWVV